MAIIQNIDLLTQGEIKQERTLKKKKSKQGQNIYETNKYK